MRSLISRVTSISAGRLAYSMSLALTSTGNSLPSLALCTDSKKPAPWRFTESILGTATPAPLEASISVIEKPMISFLEYPICSHAVLLTSSMRPSVSRMYIASFAPSNRVLYLSSDSASRRSAFFRPEMSRTVSEKPTTVPESFLTGERRDCDIHSSPVLSQPDGLVVVDFLAAPHTGSDRCELLSNLIWQ